MNICSIPANSACGVGVKAINTGIIMYMYMLCTCMYVWGGVGVGSLIC